MFLVMKYSLTSWLGGCMELVSDIEGKVIASQISKQCREGGEVESEGGGADTDSGSGDDPDFGVVYGKRKHEDKGSRNTGDCTTTATTATTNPTEDSIVLGGGSQVAIGTLEQSDYAVLRSILVKCGTIHGVNMSLLAVHKGGFGHVYLCDIVEFLADLERSCENSIYDIEGVISEKRKDVELAVVKFRERLEVDCGYFSGNVVQQ
eukprot:1525893-Rhodomonas_salina.1